MHKMYKFLRLLPVVNLRHFWRQPLRTALAVLALGAGTSLAVAVLVEEHSFNVSVAQFYKSLSGPTPLRVLGADGRGGLQASELAAVRGVPGVAAAVPMVQAVTLAQRSDGSQVPVVALGVDCSVQTLVGNIGCSQAAVARARASGPEIVSSSLASSLGPRAVVRTDEGPVSLTGAIPVAQLSSLNHGQVVVFPLPVAQNLFGRAGRLDVIYVKPSPGSNLQALRMRLAAAIGPEASVLPAGAAPPGIQYASFLVPELAMVSLFALAIGGILVYNIMSLSLVERRKELAVLSALGAGRRLVAGGALVEAGLLGAAGGLLGAAGGIAVAVPLVGNLSSLSEKFLGLSLRVHMSLWLVGVSVLLGVALAVIATLVPVRRATRLDLPAELHERSVDADPTPRSRAVRIAAMVAVTGGGLAVCEVARAGGGLDGWQPAAASIGLLVCAVGLTGFTASVAPAVLAWARRLSAGGTGTVPIAASNLAGDSRRSATVCVAIGFAVGVATVLSSLVPSIHDEAVSFGNHYLAGRVYVSTLPNNNSAGIDADLPQASVARLCHLPGVAACAEDVFVTTVDSGGQMLAIDTNGVGVQTPYAVFSGKASAADLAAGEAYVGTGLARRDGLRAGSLLRVRGLRGIVAVRVAAVWNNPDTNGTAATMTPAAIAAIWGSQPPLDVLLQPEPGTSAVQVAAEARGLHIDRNINVLTPPAYGAALSKQISASLTPFWAMQRSLMVVAFVATLSTLLLAGIQRRRQLGILAAVGLGPLQLARMTLAEAGILGFLGSAFGILSGVVLFEALRSDSTFVFGVTPPYRFDAPPALLYILLAVAVTLVGAALPAWRAARVPVLAALRYE